MLHTFFVVWNVLERWKHIYTSEDASVSQGQHSSCFTARMKDSFSSKNIEIPSSWQLLTFIEPSCLQVNTRHKGVKQGPLFSYPCINLSIWTGFGKHQIFSCCHSHNPKIHDDFYWPLFRYERTKNGWKIRGGGGLPATDGKKKNSTSGKKIHFSGCEQDFLHDQHLSTWPITNRPKKINIAHDRSRTGQNLTWPMANWLKKQKNLAWSTANRFADLLSCEQDTSKHRSWEKPRALGVSVSCIPWTLR